MAKAIVSELEKIKIWPNLPILKFEYSDPYVSSPLIIRLLVDTVLALKKLAGGKNSALMVRTAPLRETYRTPRQLWDDWLSGQDRETVLNLYCTGTGISSALSETKVPHGRSLTIHFNNGSAANILLDQGFGAWKVARNQNALFDFSAAPPLQAKALSKSNVNVEHSAPGATYLVFRKGKIGGH
jgi:hypothetical protein